MCVDVSARLSRWTVVITLLLQLAAGLVAYGRLDAKVDDLQHEMQETRQDLRDLAR